MPSSGATTDGELQAMREATRQVLAHSRADREAITKLLTAAEAGHCSLGIPPQIRRS
jgi:hypothetical protein